jgi:aminopeptidase YwaD
MTNTFIRGWLLVVTLFSVAAFGQGAKTGGVESSLRKHVDYLASPELQGRKTGEAGAVTAAGYVVNQFSQFKLKPGYRAANAKPSYMQPFPYIAGVTAAEGTYFQVVPANSGDEQKLEIGVHYMPLANSSAGDIADSQIVFAGYGIATRDKSYDDFAGIDARGKVVLVFDGVPAGGSPMQFAGMNIHAKANLAKDRGAVVLVVIARSDDFNSDHLSRLNFEPTLGETAVPVIAISRQTAVQLLGARSVAEVAEFEKWISMKTEAPPTLRIWLADPPKLSVKAKVDLEKRTVDAYNVIGIVEGRDPVLKNEAIVIGAHYDHLGRGGRSSLSPNSSDIHHGADDNASGTAAMLELARQFASEKKNKRTLIFMAFGGEEEGLLGSKHYVNNPVWPLDKTVAMINMDMVGRLSEDKLTIGGIGTADDWKGLVERLNSEPETIPSPFALQLNQDGFGPSDHSSFYGKQIPVLFFFTGTHTDYHKPSDTADKINIDGLAKITNYVSAVARSVDDRPTRPVYKVAQTAPTGGRMTFNVSLGTIPAYGDGNDGLTIDGAREGSPAAKAGLRAGDKIVKLAGKDVRNISDYMFALGIMKAGEEYEIVVKRADQTLTMKIVPAAAQPR